MSIILILHVLQIFLHWGPRRRNPHILTSPSYMFVAVYLTQFYLFFVTSFIKSLELA